MKTLFISGLLFGISMAVPAHAALAEVAENPALQALKSSRYSWMTDGLDMQGGGTTLIEMLADEVINKIQNRWEMQGDVLKSFKQAMKNPAYRSAAEEFIRQSPEHSLTVANIANNLTQNPIVQTNFYNYGILSETEESVLGQELQRYGYMQRIYNASTDSKMATLKLYRQASSPAEEMIKYSATRYGIE
ncbi:hypothetical protein [Candidatus Odyssella thessalonicensis]|uniref:hypothetical protein n=1 Tax=Candidatus Odyssella thessalonicensis TaxID=84647 RepID=UPI000225C15C|nr:hypothetical protein [Candidatus Odyssella thessalonicensis]